MPARPKKGQRESHINETPPPEFTPEEWAGLSRQLREYHRLKHRGICTRCKAKPRDDAISRSMCTRCLARTREAARHRMGSSVRYEAARSYTPPPVAKGKAGGPAPISPA